MFTFKRWKASLGVDLKPAEPCWSWSSRETFPLLWPVLSSPIWTFKFYPECTLWSFLRWIKSIKRRCSFLLACRSGLTPPRSRRTCSCYISWVYCTNQSADFQRALTRDADAKRSTDWRQTDASMFQRKGRHFCLFQLPNSSSQTFYSFGFSNRVTKSTNLKHPRFKRLSGSSGHASVLSVTVGRVL